MNLEQQDIIEAAKFTRAEIDLINETVESLIPHDPRPIVLMALASHLIGVVIRGSEGTLAKELVVDLVSKGIEEEPEKDELFDEAALVVGLHKRVSPGLLISKLNVGYTKAALLIEQLEAHGVIGPKGGTKPRKVL